MKNKKEKILFFTNELAIMLKSGLTFTTAIEIILREEKEKNFKEVLKKINQKKLGGILVYPIVVISLTLIIVTFLLTFILPNFITIFEENQVELPLITRILLFISRNFHYILLFIIALILIIFFTNMYINNNKFKRIKKDKWFLNMSIFGELRKLSLSSDLYHSFSILLSVGIGIIESVDILYMNNNNYYIKENLLEVKKSLLAGNNIATALKKLNLYNERFSILITAGEESGYLSENLLQISKILKNDFEYRLKKLMSLLEPLVVVFLGLIVAFVVVAIYLPILSIGDVFSQ